MNGTFCSIPVFVAPEDLCASGKGRDHQTVPVRQDLIVFMGMDPFFTLVKEYFSRCLKQKPDDPYALMGLGEVYSKENNADQALDCFEKLIRKSDDAILALTSAANIYRRRGRYEQAMRYYERALRVNPKNSYAWHGKADCFRGMKDYLSAISAWRMALKHGMEPRIVFTRIGDAYLGLDDLVEAELNYQKALALGYEKYAYLGIAGIHVRRNDMDRAAEILAMLAEKEPDDQRIHVEMNNLAEKYPQLRSVCLKNTELGISSLVPGT